MAVDEAGSEGYTPLYVACQEGRTEVATVLLGAGAAVWIRRGVMASRRLAWPAERATLSAPS